MSSINGLTDIDALRIVARLAHERVGELEDQVGITSQLGITMSIQIEKCALERVNQYIDRIERLWGLKQDQGSNLAKEGA